MRRTDRTAVLLEALQLGVFMVSALVFVTLLEHPASPARAALPDGTVRRVLVGLAMGLTAIALVYSPWGRRSGAHLNPAVTLAFLRLGRVDARTAVAYAAAHFAGGAAAVLAARALAGVVLADPAVRYAATVPGPAGAAAAFVAEALITFVLMTVVLNASGTPRLERFTGVLAGALVALWIAVEAPISGMSMNPARTLASALGAGVWSYLWIYFVAPPLGMLLAAELHARRGRARDGCAKLRHAPDFPCPFCGHEPAPAAAPARP